MARSIHERANGSAEGFARFEQSLLGNGAIGKSKIGGFKRKTNFAIITFRQIIREATSGLFVPRSHRRLIILDGIRHSLIRNLVFKKLREKIKRRLSFDSLAHDENGIGLPIFVPGRMKIES